MSSCPAEEDLYALAADEPVPADVRDHVQDCADCQRRVEELDDDVTSVRILGRGSSWAASAGSATRPAFIGKYFIAGTLSEDDQFIVYRGLHSALQVEVVLTRLKQTADPQSRELIADACRKLAAVQHHAVARVLDVEFADGAPCLVHERVAGTHLNVWLGQHPPTGRESQRLMLHIAEAVEDIHRHGLAHGALTPRTVVVDDQGDPHLVGFGAERLGKILSTNGAAEAGSNIAQRADVQFLTEAASMNGTFSTAGEVVRTLRRRLDRSRRIALWAGGGLIATVLLALILRASGVF